MDNTNLKPFELSGKFPEPKHGTTILGLKFKDGVVMVADTRATAGYVASPRVQKLFIIGDNTVITTAGGVSDIQYVVKLIKAEMQIFELERGRKMETTGIGALLGRFLYDQYRRTAWPYMAWLIVGGYDSKGAHVFNLEATGSILEEPYATTGSGSIFALGTLETLYEDDMDEEKATHVALMALRTAILKDLYTGDGIDCSVITKEGIKTLSKEDIKRILGDKYPFPG